MKKTLKTLTTFLLLFVLSTGIQPIPTPTDKTTKPIVSTCGDDNESDHEIIASE